MKKNVYLITISISIFFLTFLFYILEYEKFVKITITIAFLSTLYGLLYTMDHMITPGKFFNKKVGYIIIIVALIFACPAILPKLIELYS